MTASVVPATPLDRCPDCARPADGRWCANCAREIDGRRSSLADRVQRHLWRLAEMGVAIRGHGEKCITRETGGWLPADDSPTHQTCPCCKRQEWHGSFCSGCGVPTGAADWRSRLSDAQRNHLAGLNARSGGARATAPGETPEVGQAAIWPDTTPSAAFAE